MGFALWTDAGLAWAAGTSEYRSMGAAVVSDTDLFRAADFRPGRRPAVSSPTFAGHFASLGQINDYLVKARGHGRRPGEVQNRHRRGSLRKRTATPSVDTAAPSAMASPQASHTGP